MIKLIVVVQFSVTHARPPDLDWLRRLTTPDAEFCAILSTFHEFFVKPQ